MTEKLTEKNIEAMINLDKEVNTQEQLFLDLEADLNKLNIIKETLEHKRQALSDLTKLYGSNYFSGILESEALDELEEKMKEVIK